MQNLQFITHYTEQYGYADAARLALEGGCRWIHWFFPMCRAKKSIP